MNAKRIESVIILLSTLLLTFSTNVTYSIEIDRFEHITTDDGLLQNTVTCLHCDKKGFLWIGTMNGLNRYDGHAFKAFRNEPWHQESLTNNRIASIWEDSKNFIWVSTYDGYYHYFDPQKEAISTLPKYSTSQEEKFSKITYFKQYSDKEIWLGSSNSGVYLLVYDSITETYNEQQFLSRGQYPITNNNIKFIESDDRGNIWIGTVNGLNLMKQDDYHKGHFYFQHFFAGVNFSCAAANGDQMWFGTENFGVAVYDINTKMFTVYNNQNSILDNNNITVMRTCKNGDIVIATDKLYLIKQGVWPSVSITLDNSDIDKIYEDRFGYLWVSTQKFGINKIDTNTSESQFFDLSPAIFKYLSDKERPYFFEDSNDNLWICVHGSGLVYFDRETNKMVFYRNDPSKPNSLSSNTVLCMTEDKNNNLWVGTSLQGGLNKIILKNRAIASKLPNEVYSDFVENIVRALMQDSNGNIWVASKGGNLIVYDKNFNKLKHQVTNPFSRANDVSNIYSMIQDSEGYIWIGSKGSGFAVTRKPVKSDYTSIEWETVKLSKAAGTESNNIYSIKEDMFGRIWFGTYGCGLFYIERSDLKNPHFINSQNSNLSSLQIRNIFIDNKQRLWIASSFGLNYLQLTDYIGDSIHFTNIIHNPENKNSLVYNDVVHIFSEDSDTIWLGTFGGGVNMLDITSGEFNFTVYNESHGLANDNVFGIVGDKFDNLWFSTENGISRFNKNTLSFENFNRSNGLQSNGFSENTCLALADGRLVFGSDKGFDIIDPSKITQRKSSTPVVFTDFKLFNVSLDVNSDDSPLKKAIAYTDKIELKHYQSSFSLEFSTLDFLDGAKTQYAYILDNFDRSWNYVGNDRKATYTNLKPGNYVFRVKSSVGNGQWNETETSLSIKILPPWWQTTYAYITFLILFIVITYLATRLIMKVYSFRNEIKIEKAVNEVKFRFFTNVSHEIRTPLTLILGPIEDLLGDKSLPEKYKTPLLLMLRNGKRMLHLLNQLLDFRKVQNHKMSLHLASIKIDDFVKNIFENFEAFAKHKEIDYNLVPAELSDSSVWIDPKRMDSVIFNILSNAFKNTPKGEKIKVSITENQSEIAINISDSGSGIKEQEIPLLFERYSMLSDLNTSSNTGTGIGLSLSNEVVKLHKGSIAVTNNPDKGCTFTILIRKGRTHFDNDPNVFFDGDSPERAFVSTSEMAATEQLTETEESDTESDDLQKDKSTLLIVEDNDQIIDYIKNALSDNYNILKCRDGKTALEIVESNHPDLIVSDIMMPVMDGVEMTKVLKKNFDTCHIPVVLLTARTSLNDQITGFDAGAEAYVLKPFNMEILKSIINSILVHRKILFKKFCSSGENIYPSSDNVITSEESQSTKAVELTPTNVKITSRDQEFIDNLIKYIEDNYSNSDININNLAEFSCVSRTVFYNKVKALTGVSPVEFHRQIKLKIAAKMLEKGYNVSEAAMNIGFNDTRYFSRQFKELFGESPSQYRKRHTGIDSEQ